MASLSSGVNLHVARKAAHGRGKRPLSLFDLPLLDEIFEQTCASHLEDISAGALTRRSTSNRLRRAPSTSALGRSDESQLMPPPGLRAKLTWSSVSSRAYAERGFMPGHIIGLRSVSASCTHWNLYKTGYPLLPLSSSCGLMDLSGLARKGSPCL